MVASAQLMTFPGMLFRGCSDVGVPDGQEQAVEKLGVADGTVLYTPDGGNECRIPIPAIGTPIALAVCGAVLGAYGWYRA